jgi:formylglycine-generating enzyme required for sulfatase activity
MTDDPVAQPTAEPRRKRARRWWLAFGVVGLVLAGWWFGVALPERRAAAELKRQQAEKSFRIADLGLDMVWIPPGTFLMGTPEQRTLAKWFYDTREKLTKKPNLSAGDPNERPVTIVTLTRQFWLGRTEVTQAQWTAVMGSKPNPFNGDDLPVEIVSWDDAMEFCRKLTERERAVNRLPAGYAYTLPTEAQWEYACRAGTTGDYAGDIGAMAWTRENSGGSTHPVGTKQVNAWGLADMHGNVWEWCLDWYVYYRGGVVTNPRGPTSGSLRVGRGGGWANDTAFARSAFRLHLPPDIRLNNLSFRVALTPSPLGSLANKN